MFKWVINYYHIVLYLYFDSFRLHVMQINNNSELIYGTIV